MNRRDAIRAYCRSGACHLKGPEYGDLCAEVLCPLWHWRLGDPERAAMRFEAAIKAHPSLYQSQLADCPQGTQYKRGY